MSAQTDSKVNGTALSSPSTSSQRSDSSLPVLRVAASQTTDTMGEDTHTHTQLHTIRRTRIRLLVYQEASFLCFLFQVMMSCPALPKMHLGWRK